jgi:hypothetical protein
MGVVEDYGTMPVLGANCTKQSVFLAEVEASAGLTVVSKAWPPIACSYRAPGELLTIYDAIRPVLEACLEQGHRRIAVLACASGRHGAANETVKVEAVLELIAAQLEMSIEPVTPQSLKGVFACARSEKWQSKAKDLLNPGGKIAHWTSGMGGAVAAAHKALHPEARSRIATAKKSRAKAKR